ncbi:hypothetical protein ACFVYJ_04335 [Pontibacter sp. JAM-7]|uniref:hypothetical protein n=1 Tax=Pontibacter sp. JAM-7 TaxID=3366581 RepID=UPI003AF70B5C
MPKLVKDFEDYKVIYFWLDDNNQCISAHFPTLAHAKEWFIQYHFNQYTGPERRKRLVDRRSSESKVLNHAGSSKRGSKASHGRRITDRPIRVDIDLATEKLSAMVKNSSVRLVKTS